MEGGINGDRMALVSTHENMQYSEIGEGGARELARALRHNICIAHLDVGVCWWKEGSTDLVRALMIACSIMKLEKEEHWSLYEH